MGEKVNFMDSIKKFAGEQGQDVNLWFDRLEVVLRLSSLQSQAAKMFPLFIEGVAYATWKQLSEERKEDFEEIKKEFMKVFGKSKTLAWMELKRLKYASGDSVDVLAEEIEARLTLVASGKRPQGELVSAFLLDALPSTTSNQIRMQYDESLDLEQITSSAKSLLASEVYSVHSHVAETSFGLSASNATQPSSLKKELKVIRCFLL